MSTLANAPLGFSTILNTIQYTSLILVWISAVQALFIMPFAAQDAKFLEDKLDVDYAGVGPAVYSEVVPRYYEVY